MQLSWLKSWKFWLVVVILILIFLVMGGREDEDEFGGSRGDIYPDTDAAPVIELSWDGVLDPSDTTRYTPYGIWEGITKTPKGVTYEPANEMQFYIKTDADKLLAGVPGVVRNSQTFDGVWLGDDPIWPEICNHIFACDSR